MSEQERKLLLYTAKILLRQFKFSLTGQEIAYKIEKLIQDVESEEQNGNNDSKRNSRIFKSKRGNC